MKCLTAFCAILFVVSMGTVSTAAAPEGIQLLSWQYDLSGQWDDKWYQMDVAGAVLSGVYSGSYQASSSDGTPITAHVVSFPLGWKSANARIEDFSLYNDAYASALHFPSGPGTYGSDGDGGSIYTQASGYWQFRPLHPLLEVRLDIKYEFSYYPWEQGLNIKLTDLTVGADLFSYSPTWTSPPVTYQLNVDLNHTYDFSISGWSSNFDAKYTTEHVNATLSAVPEPAVFLLFGLGLGVLAGVARRARQL
jgi:hypothetical protein